MPNPGSPMPYLEDAFLAALAKFYPPVITTPADDLATIMYRAGQQSVVARLKQEAVAQRDHPHPLS